MREVGEFDSVALVGAMTKAFLAPFETMDQIRYEAIRKTAHVLRRASYTCGHTVLLHGS
ncbi:hypothetical protein Hdeb2414_s0007g00256801 [Helianthus debilis subsp. tardiflorus]